MTNQIFTKKFWKGVKTDGFLLNYLRGQKAVQHAHSVGGYSDLATFVGQDQFGNRYYEDLGAARENLLT